MKLSFVAVMCGLLALSLGAPAFARQSECLGFDDAGYPNPTPIPNSDSILAIQDPGVYVQELEYFTSHQHTYMVEWDGSEGYYLDYNFDGSNLSDATFKAAELAGAVFRCTRLHRVNFTNADLTRANFEGADIEGADFTGATLDFALWTDGRRCGTGSVGTCNQL